MADPARTWTDKQLAEMELHIRQIYAQSRAELTAKWNDYMERGQARLERLHANYVSAPADQKADALKRYQDAVQNYTFRNRWYRDMVNETTYRLAHVNEIALSYINGKIPAIYSRNFNQIDPDALLVRTNWTLRNEQMVRNLMLDSLPQKTLNYAKDMAWNQRQINTSLLQGIIQGESIPKISARIFSTIHDPTETNPDIIHKNEVASIRTARTMVTGAENKGRLDRYHEYEEQGLVMNKVWIATPDGRTRAWHLSMDGQEVGPDDVFYDGHGNPLEYPGDPSGAPDSIYNCRCSMRSHILGVRQSNGKIDPIKNYRTQQSFHERQIENERGRRGG